MRILAVFGALACLVAGAFAADTAAGAAAPTATAKVVVRPVTATGRVASGFTLHVQSTGSVDCSDPLPSPAAVSKNIEFCSPSAEYAVSCWKSALAHRALCMRNPRSKDVYRIPRAGAFAPTPIAPVKYRAPQLLKLGDGDFCTIRDGGAWGTLTGHPNLFGTYACLHAGIVWAAASAPHLGVNEANPLWTVRTAPAGNHPLVTHHVVRAWFVGTRSS
jgi:hypothetical protein